MPTSDFFLEGRFRVQDQTAEKLEGVDQPVLVVVPYLEALRVPEYLVELPRVNRKVRADALERPMVFSELRQGHW